MIKLAGITTLERFKEYTDHVLEGGFVWDEESEVVLQIIEAFDQGKSILIIGNPGSFKTKTFQVLRKITNPHTQKGFVFRACRTCVELFENEDNGGTPSFPQYYRNNYFFDDLYTENIGRHFGKQMEVMEHIISLNRYQAWENGLKTYMTCNYDLIKMKERYGARFVSRVQEMFEIVVMGDKLDKRKLKNFKGWVDVFHPVILSEADQKWKDNYEAACRNYCETHEPQSYADVLRKRHGLFIPPDKLVMTEKDIPNLEEIRKEKGNY